jgi:hypothetical protein
MNFEHVLDLDDLRSAGSRSPSSDWTYVEDFNNALPSVNSHPSLNLLLTDSSRQGEKMRSVEDVVKARNWLFLWTFLSYMSWGIVTELYTDLFDDVIDSSSYGTAAFYSTVAMSVYSIVGLLWSPVMATLSDSVGRKPIFVLSAGINATSGILMGLIPGNWPFILFVALQGLGGKNAAVGYALLVDYQAAVPCGWSGGDDDDRFHQFVLRFIRFGTCCICPSLCDGE